MWEHLARKKLFELTILHASTKLRLQPVALNFGFELHESTPRLAESWIALFAAIAFRNSGAIVLALQFAGCMPTSHRLSIRSRMKGATQKLKLIPTADAKVRILQPVLEKHISPDVTTIYTDEHVSYPIALQRTFNGKHKTINHSRTYGIGPIHTNTIENAFSPLKRGLSGTYHKVSMKHLGRYCNEFSYRFNRRSEQLGIFDTTLKNLTRG